MPCMSFCPSTERTLERGKDQFDFDYGFQVKTSKTRRPWLQNKFTLAPPSEPRVGPGLGEFA